ncbi:MAG: hypothetical protein AAB091_02615 [Elusimicrobiota bacterium]
MSNGSLACPVKNAPAGQLERIIFARIEFLGTNKGHAKLILERAAQQIPDLKWPSLSDIQFCFRRFANLMDNLASQDPRYLVKELIDKIVYHEPAGFIETTLKIPDGYRGPVSDGSSVPRSSAQGGQYPPGADPRRLTDRFECQAGQGPSGKLFLQAAYPTEFQNNDKEEGVQ